MLNTLTSFTGLSLDRLLTLCQVAEAGSIGQAAGGDTNRQSQFSRQISELESHFGRPLLERSSRPYRLNEAGKRLAALTRMFLIDLEVFRTQTEQQEWRVVLGAGESLIQGLLMPASERVKPRLRSLRFAFRNLASEEVLSQLQAGEIDLGVLGADEVTPALATTPALTYALEAWVPKSLSQETGMLKAVELAVLPWAVLEGKGHFGRFLRVRAEAAGVQLKVGVECSSYAQVASAIQSGRYAGFLPSFHPEPSMSDDCGVRRRKVDKVLRYERTLVLAWLRRAEAFRPAFLEMVNLFQRALRASHGVRLAPSASGDRIE